jgi:hypothetical protein
MVRKSKEEQLSLTWQNLEKIAQQVAEVDLEEEIAEVSEEIANSLNLSKKSGLCVNYL